MATLRTQGPPGRGGEGSTGRAASAIPEATVARLPVYLRALRALAERGTATASSEELAAIAGVNSAKLRKDLSYLGSYGTRGVGYDVEYLVYQISRELGLSQDWPVAIIGIGNLGHALANYGGFVSRGFRIAALLDADPRLSGNRVAGLVIRHIDELDEAIAENGISIAVIAVPPDAAQDVANRLVAAGITSILNFAPAVVTVPDGVSLRKVDLSVELQILAFHEQRKIANRAAPGALRTARTVRRLREDPVNPGEFDDASVSTAYAGATSLPAADCVADTTPIPRYSYDEFDEVRPA
ncbi:redox-sensing transcriptional repressor Rex [Actinocrinis puniceicyclus]|uniref:Redox-sensing transcriptional repressor Rex n=1 Tax=Actinocrinis puniceicyclus TaxID=977794 RepID=A0A8J8BCF7_9ACTN|nr:redox-sensing transcriptional repressor Rex [Actinocrinis puniceicyclus]MBS2965062.1 redox-sensing transcriptional repressor Rex [Actinocrinis puniceicyclus]